MTRANFRQMRWHRARLTNALAQSFFLCGDFVFYLESDCMKNITEIRHAIDQIDQEIIIILAKRQRLVEQAGRLKIRTISELFR